MQALPHDHDLIQGPAALPLASGILSRAAMAGHLRRADPVSARCFAEAMYEGSAWANESWGAYWADVIRLV